MLRLLKNGRWSLDPRLVVARRVVFSCLVQSYPMGVLGELATFQNGRSYDKSRVSHRGTPIIRISNITDPDGDYIFTTEEFPEKWWVRPGDLLVSWSASFKTRVWDGPAGMLNQHIFKVSPASGVHRNYLRHLIEASFADMRSNEVGIGMMHLRRDAFLRHPAAKPDLEIQVAVSKYLDEIEQRGQSAVPLPTSLVPANERIQKFVELFEKIEAVRRARYRAPAALLGRVVGVGQEGRLLLQAALGRISEKHADCAGCLKDVLVESLRHGPALACTENATDGAIPVLMPSATTGFGLDVSRLAFLPPGTELSKLDYLEPGDIIFARGNKPEQVGTAGLYEGQPAGATYANLFMRMRADLKRVDARFLLYWLMTPLARDHVRRHTKGTGPSIQKINSSGVHSLPFPVGLPIRTQRRYVQILDSIKALTRELEELVVAQTGKLDVLVRRLAGDATDSPEEERGQNSRLPLPIRRTSRVSLPLSSE